MSLSNEERKAIVEFRIEKALRAYEQAKGVLPLGYWETIANRLYYAAYNAVSALLIANGDNAQTHAGVTHLFGMRFVNTGICSNKESRIPSPIQISIIASVLRTNVSNHPILSVD